MSDNKGNPAGKIESLEKLLHLFRLERIVYLVITVLCLLLLLFAIYSIVDSNIEEGGNAEIIALLTSSGGIIYSSGRLLSMWRDALRFINKNDLEDE